MRDEDAVSTLSESRRQVGLHYNYFRDYDPRIGRYIESDPIGLQGGLNTYSYVYDNPLRFVDPTGELSIVAGGRAGAAVGAAIGSLIPGAGTAAGAAIGFGIGAAATYLLCKPESEEDKQKKRCQSLKDSILNTCYGLTGRKRMACFEAANTSYRQCMGWE